MKKGGLYRPVLSDGEPVSRSRRWRYRWRRTRSDSWPRIFADVFGIEIRPDAQPLAVNARGAIGTALVLFAGIAGLMRKPATLALPNA